MKSGISSSSRHGYLCPVVMPFVLPTSVYGAMLVIWHLRPSLQKIFPLHQGKAWDYLRFLAWCAIAGRRKYKILHSLSEWDSELSRPVSLPLLKGDGWKNGFSVAMLFHGAARYHYTFDAILDRADARNDAARAYWRGEPSTRFIPSSVAWHRDYLARKFGTMNEFIQAIRMDERDAGKTNEELAEAFALSRFDNFAKSSQERNGGGTATEAASSAHLSVPMALLPERQTLRFRASRRLASIALTSQRARARRKPSEFQLSAVTRFVPFERKGQLLAGHFFGVNLLCCREGNLGLGEEVRAIASALQARQIPFCIINTQPGNSISQEERFAAHWMAEKPQYGINLLCRTGLEQVRFACEQGIDYFAGRYNIGFFPWELSYWPPSYQYLYGMVDEIWRTSTYTTQALLNAPRPVYAMSLPVTLGPIAEKSRANFGLPEEPYLFVFAFDNHSGMACKNSTAVIQAFQKAFPAESGREVGLVLRVDPSDLASDTVSLIRQFAESDRRIHVITKAMRRPEVLALYRACDCFVSLYRAEGFDRSLVEALLLKLQVIATGFSDNMDLCAEPRVGLVRYHLRPLQSGEHAWAHGQMWAEPDIDHAAELMGDIRRNPRNTDVDFDFSPETVGQRYAQRLEKIRGELQLPNCESSLTSLTTDAILL